MMTAQIGENVLNRPPEWIARDAFYLYERALDRFTEGAGEQSFACLQGNYRIELDGSAYDLDVMGATLRVLDTTGTCVLSAICQEDFNGDELPTEMVIRDMNATGSLLAVGQAFMSPLEKAILTAQHHLPALADGTDNVQVTNGNFLYVREGGDWNHVIVFAQASLIDASKGDGYEFIAQQFDDGGMTGSPYYQIPAVAAAIEQAFNAVVQDVQQAIATADTTPVAKLKGDAFVTAFKDGGACVFEDAALDLANVLGATCGRTRHGKPMLSLKVGSTGDRPPLAVVYEQLPRLGYNPKAQSYEAILAAKAKQTAKSTQRKSATTAR